MIFKNPEDYVKSLEFCVSVIKVVDSEGSLYIGIRDKSPLGVDMHFLLNAKDGVVCHYKLMKYPLEEIVCHD